MKKLLSLLVFSFIIIGITSAQKLKIENGSFAPIKNESNMNVKFVYDGMRVGKYKNENDYIEKRRGELNAKEEGRGDKWAAAWVDDRDNRFHVKFKELFHDHQDKITLIEDDDTLPYTLIFQVTYTEPGYNIGISRSNAYIDAAVYIVETQNPDNVVTQVSIRKSPGRDAWGFDFDTGTRIAEAYAAAGKSLAKFIKKETKK